MENPVTEKMVTLSCVQCGNVIDITGLSPGDGITCPYCAKEFPVTRQFGNFLLEKQLGSGGMGAVYLGRDTSLNRTVAVKVLRPELVADQKFLSTFLREVEITASLNHPNIVQVYAFGEHEGVYFMVVEYIPGGSLDDKIMNLGQITELEGIEIGIAVARGLECALERGGLIHRDIKPGNILFNANNTPKVVDFGLSLSVETTDHFDGEIWGTPYYVAPEKLERLPEDFRSDLYSLGATLFHAISGRPPYEGEDPNDVAMKHLTGSVISLKAFVPDISDQTSYAISKAMSRYPEDRYESYAAFISQLEDAKRRITDPAYRERQGEEEMILGNAENVRYGKWLMAGLGVIVLALVGLLIWKGPAMLHPNAVPTTMLDYHPSKYLSEEGKNPALNLALGKPFISSDPNTNGWNVGLTDGTHIFATSNSPTFPKHVVIDLQGIYTISRVVVAMPPFGSTREINIAVSRDGRNYTWLSSHTFPQAKEVRYPYIFKPTEARYVKLTYYNHYPKMVDGYNPNFAFTSAVEVYANK